MLAGIFIHHHHDPATALKMANAVRPFSTIFLNLIKMVIAPLIFATLVAGIAGAGHVKTVGRMGLRAVIYFEVVTTLALLIGLVTVNLLRPGEGVALAARPADVASTGQTWDQILVHAVPTSVIDAMARGDVLQIVVFSIIFAIALGMLGAKGPAGHSSVRGDCRDDVQIHEHHHVLRANRRRGRHGVYGRHRRTRTRCWGSDGSWGPSTWLCVVFYLAVLVPVCWLFKIPIGRFLRAVREPALIAFSTTSSEAALPRAMEVMEDLGCPRRIVAFVLPLGYTFNLDGSTLYLSMAAIFVAQAAGVHLSDRATDHDDADAHADEQRRRRRSPRPRW